MRNKEQMLYDIGIVSFVVTELVLYLDTHMQDETAIEYLNHYNRIRQEMLQEFAKEYYPLTLDSMEGSDRFTWGMAPLPWEVC